ncbi:MAG: hypothetical protein ACE5OW_02245 [Candidatus Bathyarchaeia archaeon]
MRPEKVLERVANELIRSIKGVESIVLCNSHARGEPTALSDYDLEVIIKTPLLPIYLPKIKRLEKELNKKIGVKIKIGPNSVFLMKRAPRNAFFYDLKFGGKVLYGKNLLTLIPINRGHEVEKSSCVEFLFNLLVEFVSNLDVGFFFRKLRKEEEEKLTYTCSKMFLGCCAGLLILKGMYKSTYQQRVTLFTRIFRKEFPLLYEKVPEFLHYVNASYEYRSKCSFLGTISPLDFWFLTRYYFGKILVYCLRNTMDLGLESGDWIRICEEFLSKSYLPIFNNLQFFILVSLLEEKHEKVSPFVVFSRRPVAKSFQSALLLTTFSISREGSIDGSMIKHAYDLVKGYMPARLRGSSDRRVWNKLRKWLISYYNYACPLGRYQLGFKRRITLKPSKG